MESVFDFLPMSDVMSEDHYLAGELAALGVQSVEHGRASVPIPVIQFMSSIILLISNSYLLML